MPVLFLLADRFFGCTDQGEIWQGGATLPNFTLISSGVGVYGPKAWNFTNIIAHKGHTPCAILTKFTGFMHVLSLHKSAKFG